jgi:hypothetical protein
VLTGPRSDSPGSGGSDEVGRAGPRQAKFTEFTKGYVPKGCDGPSLTTDLYAVGQSIEDFLSDAAEMVCGSVLLLYRCRCMCTCVSRSAVGSRRTGVLVCAWLVCLCASDCCEVLYVGKFWLFCVVLVLCRIFTAAVCVTLSVCARSFEAAGPLRRRRQLRRMDHAIEGAVKVAADKRRDGAGRRLQAVPRCSERLESSRDAVLSENYFGVRSVAPAAILQADYRNGAVCLM